MISLRHLIFGWVMLLIFFVFCVFRIVNSCFVCLHPVSCVPNVASVYGLLICDYFVLLAFVLCLVCPMLPVSLNCSFLIILFLSVFVLCLVRPMLPVSLNFSFYTIFLCLSSSRFLCQM